MTAGIQDLARYEHTGRPAHSRVDEYLGMPTSLTLPATSDNVNRTVTGVH